MKLIKPATNGKKTETPTIPENFQIPEFYSNTVTINFSPFEFELGHLLLDSKGVVKGAINIRLSPQTAKSVYEILGKQLENYEEKVGEIALPSVGN
jgi:hypothetical protein